LSYWNTVGQIDNRKIANRSFDNLTKLNYLGTTTKNQNFINGEIKMRWNTVNASYHSAQNISFIRLLSKIETIKIVPVVLYGCDIWFLRVNEEHRVKVFENRVLRSTSGPRGIK
jgi:hypothetical protein